MLTINSWTKGKAWAEALPTNVKNVRKVALPNGRLRIYGDVRNSRGAYQQATAVVSNDLKQLFECDGGTTLENGEKYPYTYHVAALISIVKR